MAATPQQVKERRRPAAPPQRDVGAALAALSEEKICCACGHSPGYAPGPSRLALCHGPTYCTRQCCAR